jgi:hypothetical protein
MSNTSNFDYCVQFAIAAVKAVFHLALKNEDMFPHNLPPMPRNFGGHAATVRVELLDDETDPADLSFLDEKRITFHLPVRILVEIPDAPDPSLTSVALKALIDAPGTLATWPVDGEDQLGIDFAGIAAGDVSVPSVTGLPSLDSARFVAAIHTRYSSLPTHSFSLGGNTLNLYDGTRDLTLVPPNKPGNPEISATLELHSGVQYLKLILPIHADVTSPVAFASYGIATCWRRVEQGTGTVTVKVDEEPAEAALATTIAFDSGGPIANGVANALKPLLIQRLAAFAPVSEPWFTESEAKDLIAVEAAAYLAPRKFPFYTPRSGDPDHPLETPVGFLLVASETLAILMNRRTGTAADDTAPDDFRSGNQLALALSRAKLDETITQAMNDEFPGVNNGGSLVSTEEGDATLLTLSVTPSDPGQHDQAEGHLWVSGTAEVHIDCWPDPDVSFDGPIFLRLRTTETDTECTAVFDPEMGEFDAGQSCCDVFIDLIIPVIGWIMLGVIEAMIDDVGGELAEEFADAQERQMQPIPTFVVGVAELQACLERCDTSSQGLVLPGKLRIRREGTSFEDLAASGDLPRP